MARNMKDIGKRINKTEKEKKHGPTELVTKENIYKEKNRAMENLSGPMVACTMATSLITIFMEKEFTLGVIRDNILEIGKTTKWTEKEFLYGLTKENTKENTRMIKKKVMAFLNGT